MDLLVLVGVGLLLLLSISQFSIIAPRLTFSAASQASCEADKR